MARKQCPICPAKPKEKHYESHVKGHGGKHGQSPNS